MRSMKNLNKEKKGLTLVEIMIVVAILSILVSLGVPGFLRSRNKARRDTCINNLRMIEHAADQYRIDLNMPIGDPTEIKWLWPTSFSGKSVSSYINKRLKCPSGSSVYVGGTESSPFVATNDNIEANAYPHCVVAVGNTVPTHDGTDSEHSIEDAES